MVANEIRTERSFHRGLGSSPESTGGLVWRTQLSSTKLYARRHDPGRPGFFLSLVLCGSGDCGNRQNCLSGRPRPDTV